MSDSTRTKVTAVTVGIDLGDKRSHLFVLDHQTGEVLEEGSITTTPNSFKRRFAGLVPARIALEAGAHSRWVAELLEEQGHEVIVANPRKIALITANDSKSDRVDPELLARLARADPRLLHPIVHRGAKAQADLALIRARDALVRTRTVLVNHVRGTVKVFGKRLSGCSTESFASKVRGDLPDELRPALEPVLDQVKALTASIKSYDRQVEATAKKTYPETERLRQVTGVGALTALAFVLTLEDPFRFKSSRAVGSYLGLRPRQRDSGDRNPQLRVTKAGDSYLRRLLVGSAHYVLGHFGPDCDLRRWGLRLAERGGKNAKRRAVVAVARKLSVLLHRLWLTGEDYEPLRHAARPTACAASH